MIRFSLQCSDAHRFDGWFRSGDDFLTQQKRGLLACPECGSTTVEKALMTPSVPKKSNQTPQNVEPETIEAQPDAAPAAAPAQGPASGSMPAMKPGSGPQISQEQGSGPTPGPATAPSAMSMTQGPAQNPLADLPPELKGKVISAIKEWRDNMISNSEHVGPRFAEEARKIHFNEAKERPIYGEASADEVEELLEDGIPCAPLPVLPEDHN